MKNVGVALTGNTGSSDFLADGGKLNVRGEGRVSAAVADENTKDSRLTLTFDDKGMVKAGKNVTVDEKQLMVVLHTQSTLQTLLQNMIS